MKLGALRRLEDQRDGLEAELKKVNASLAAASARLKKTREEKDQFDDASNQMIMHLKTKEDELAKSVTLCNVEADIVHIWINFLQDTWKVQSSCIEHKDKQINEEVEKYGNHFVKLIRYHLSSFKDDLSTSIIHISTLVENLKRFNDRYEGTQDWDKLAKELNPKKCLEEEYLAIETKIVTAFSIVDHMEELFYTEREKGSRRDDPAVNELFESIEKLRLHFESIERPILEIEETARESEDKLPKEPCSTVKISSPRLRSIIETPRSTPRTPYYLSDPESEITQLELEFQKGGKQYSVQDINGWDFD